MSEYWKSLPRKFCDICKCWFADNKASIEFHERGKRHQENAQKRIQDIQKRGIKDFKKQKQLEDDMAKIEKAALAAYKKDLQNNLEAVPSPIPSLTNEIETISSCNEVKVPKSKKTVTKLMKFKEKVIVKKEVSQESNIKRETLEPLNHVTVKKEVEPDTRKWYEAVSEEGYKYYWNGETSETQWEPPEEGFVTIEEQSNPQPVIENDCPQIKEEPKDEEENNDNNNISDDDDEPACSVGPQPKVDPYGKWTTVEYKVPEQIDLQLPKPSENFVEVIIPVATDEPKLKFKEKLIGQLTDSDPSEGVTFKKRKFTGSAKRNTRQRFTDDD